MVSTAFQDDPVSTVPGEQRVRPLSVLPVAGAVLALQAVQVISALQATTVSTVLQARTVKTATQEPWVLPDDQVLAVTPVHQDDQASAAVRRWDQLVIQVLKVKPVLQVDQVFLVLLVLLVRLGETVGVQLDPPVQLVPLVLLVKTVDLVCQAVAGLPLDFQVVMVPLDDQVFQVPMVRLVFQVLLVVLVPRVMPDEMEFQVDEAKPVVE